MAKAASKTMQKSGSSKDMTVAFRTSGTDSGPEKARIRKGESKHHVSLNKDLAALLARAIEENGQTASKLMEVSLRTFLTMTPDARETLVEAVDDMTEDERDLLAKAVSRAVLASAWDVINTTEILRVREEERQSGKNMAPFTEEEIAAEAVELCRT